MSTEVTVINRVARVVMNRPNRRNALGTASMTELGNALRLLDRDDEVGAILLVGADPAFCAGSDLKELAGLSIPEMCDHEAHSAAIARQIGMLSKPVIALVQGYALGGGFILAVSCDLVVSAESARWNLPEVKNGWLPPWGLQALVARVGSVVARRLTWGVDPIDGKEAARLGVVDYVVADAELAMFGEKLAQNLADLPVNAVASTKQFYQSRIMNNAEVDDAFASAAFAADCEHEVAQTTLSKFGG